MSWLHELCMIIKKDVTHVKALETARLLQRNYASRMVLPLQWTDHKLREEINELKGADNTVAE